MGISEKMRLKQKACFVILLVGRLSKTSKATFCLIELSLVTVLNLYVVVNLD